MIKNFPEKIIQDKNDLYISRGLVDEIQRNVFQRVKDEFGKEGDYSVWIASWVMANQKENGGSLRSLIEQELRCLMTEYNIIDEKKLRENQELMSGVVMKIYNEMFARLVNEYLKELRDGGAEKSDHNP